MTVETTATVSLETFSRLAHISKRKAKWLLENGHIPCLDTGKKTHRFVISMKDVHKFLRSPPPKCPVGIFNNKPTADQSRNSIAQIDSADFRKYLTLWWCNKPDALQVQEIASLLGYTCPTVRHWLNCEKLRYVLTQRGPIIPKPYLINFVSTYTIQHPGNLSSIHRALVTTYLVDNSWQP